MLWSQRGIREVLMESNFCEWLEWSRGVVGGGEDRL